MRNGRIRGDTTARVRSCGLAALMFACSAAPQQAPVIDPRLGPASRPVPRTDPNSRLAHEQLVQKAKQGGIDVYFVGDSITRRWGASDPQYRPLLENWRTNFFGWNAANFGWGADRVENMLWRLQNGELEGVNPKVIVLLAGINNVGTQPADAEKVADITRGLNAILDVCREKAPGVTIVITGIFPRNDNLAVIPTIRQINRNLAGLADGKQVRYLDINDQLAAPDGRLFPGMMNQDRLHPTLKAYQLWADALKPIFTELLGPPARTDHAPPTTGDPSANIPQVAAGKKGQAVNVMWRFDGGGRFPDIHPPGQWGAGQNILWKTPVEAGGYSSPIVVKGKIFVTAEMGSLICLDAADGKVLWQKDLFSKDSKEIPAELSNKLMRGCGGESKQSTPTPASNGELVFYINAMGLSACYDFAGNQKWIRVIETSEDEEQFTSSPIFLGDKIILSWGCLLALDAKDGKTLWKAADAKSGYGTPAIPKIGGEALAVTPGGAIVRAADGAVLCSGQFESAYASPLVEGGVVYVIDATAKALELPPKAEKGMRLKELWNTELTGTFMASPVYRDGLIYTIENQKCRLHIIDARTGQVLTCTQAADAATKSEKIETGLKIEGMAPAKYAYGSPTAAEGNVFFFDDAGHAAVLRLGRQSKLLRVNKIEDAILGTPFFFDDRIIIRGARTVYCIGAKP